MGGDAAWEGRGLPMGLVLYLLAAAMLLAVLVGLIVLVIGPLFGGVLGGLIGGASGAWKAPPGQAELGTYRGLVWGGCLGVGLGLLVAVLLLAAAWTSFTSTPPKAPAPDTYPQKEREEPPALRTLPSVRRAASSAGTSATAPPYLPGFVLPLGQGCRRRDRPGSRERQPRQGDRRGGRTWRPRLRSGHGDERVRAIIFRLSQKLNAKVKGGTLAAVPLDENPFADWSAALFVACRTQYILLSNTKALYSTVMYGKGVTDAGSFVERALGGIREFMEDDGQEAVYRRFVAPASASVRFAKALDRSVTRSMNDLINHARAWLAGGDLSPHEVGVRLNDVLLSALGRGKSAPYGRSRDALRALVGSVGP
jgi:hypothetical protein